MKSTKPLQLISGVRDWARIVVLVTVLPSLPGATRAAPALPRLESDTWRIAPIEPQAPYTGFVCELRKTGWQVLIRFGSVGNLTALVGRVRRETDAPVLRFTRLKGQPTPGFARDSYIEVGIDPRTSIPEIRFRLHLKEFNQAAWRAGMGDVPFHFMVCAQPDARIFHQRGWPVPTPLQDPYPMLSEATRYGVQIRSFWSKAWTYAPPIGAWPIPAMGLWTPERGQYVAYDFHAARLGENSARDVGAAYCWKFRNTGRFMALVWPYARPYQKLRFPQLPDHAVIASRFHLLATQRLYPDDDPNLFVQEFAWKYFADAFPGAPRMNDLSWLSAPYRLKDFPASTLGRLYRKITKTRWWKAGTVDVGGLVWDGDPVTVAFENKRQAQIDRLRKDVDFMLTKAQRFRVGPDECVSWRKPLSGEAVDMFGPEGVPTLHNIQTWQVALAFLDLCRNDPSQRERLLPIVDGVLRWTRHVLYTRNGYADVPAAQFCWGAGPVTTFCLRYYYTFRDDPKRQDLAALALKLARTMLYRYLPIWLSDSNKTDALDSSFFMEPNSGISWLGAACSNEVWVIPHALTQVYVATGDPLLAHCLRGMLERWHQLYRDQYAPNISAYGTAFSERLGLYDGAAQAPGTRAGFGGLWGLFERLAWPMGEAKVRFVCGEAAAIAFDRNGKHTDLAEYRSYGNGRFSCRIVPLGDAASHQKGPFAICVTYPFFDLRKQAVWRIRDGEKKRLAPGRLLRTFAQRPDTVLVRGMRYGDTLAVGRFDPGTPVRPCPKLRTRRLAHGRRIGRSFCQDLAPTCNVPLRADWDDPKSWAGLDPGLRWLYGVPFELVDPMLNKGRNAAKGVDIPLTGRADDLFILVAGAPERLEGRVNCRRGRPVAIQDTHLPPVIEGWPQCFDWKVSMLHVRTRGRELRSLQIKDTPVLAVTTVLDAPAAVRQTLAALDKLRNTQLLRRQRVQALLALSDKFQALSGRIAVLPLKRNSNPYALPIVKALHNANLMKHVHLLTPGEFVDPSTFNADRFWITLYLGGEEYWRSVNRQGDGDQALLRYLDRGGTLLVLPTGPFPFYYDQNDKVVVAAGRFGLPICGSGAGQRQDAPANSRLRGWEKPPTGHAFVFKVAPNQQIVRSLPPAFLFPKDEEADQRWRPLAPSAARGPYKPLITLTDETGRSWGDAAALLGVRRGRVLSVWSTLLKMPRISVPLIADVLGFALNTALPPIAETVCLRTSQPPVIDGRLDDPIWKAVPILDDFHLLGPGLRKPHSATRLRMCWDDTNLYLAFDAQDPDIWSDKTGRDEFLWEGEVVEFYIDPDGDGKHYKEFEINPRNAVLDLNIAQPTNGGVPLDDVKRFLRWNAAGLKTAVRVDGTLEDRTDADRGWQVEAAIPFASLVDSGAAAPRVGDAWRVQFFRIDRSRGLKKPDLASWSPTRLFHTPDRFGSVVFGGPAVRDDFSLYPAGEAPGPPWQVLTGKWTVEHGALVGENSGTDAWHALGIRWGNPAWRDYTVTVAFQIEARGSDWRDGPWFGVRCSGRDGYFVDFSNRDVQLHKVSGGVGTDDATCLARASCKLGTTPHVVAISVRGRRLRIRLDGRQLLDVVDDRLNDTPALEAGTVVLSARRWSGGRDVTRVRYDSISVEHFPN
ncbi:MAG: hypothetical protein GXP31_02695 [Kiritimatiellaeota bacterium]|nr:hypothetical protein [Kiritimatiellota bacterium]